MDTLYVIIQKTLRNGKPKPL